MLKKLLCFTIIAAIILSLGACKPKATVTEETGTDVILYYDAQGNPITDGSQPLITLSPEAAKVRLDASDPGKAPEGYDPTAGKDYGKMNHVDFSLGWSNGTINMQGDSMGKYIENKFNVTFDVELLENDKIVLLAAQNHLPDLVRMAVGSTEFTQLEADNYLYHIPRTLVASYPLLQRYFNNHAYLNAYSNISSDKQYVGLPFMNNSTHSTIGYESSVYYRKDWASKVGMGDVTIDTVDKQYELYKRFRNDDPDGNGLKDTYGFTGFLWSIDWVPWVDTYSWVKETDPTSPYNGMYVPGFVNSKMFGAITWWNRLLKEQIIPADFNLNSNGMDKLIANQAGSAYGNSSIYWYWEFLVNRFDPAHKDYYTSLPKIGGRTQTVNDVVGEFPPLKLSADSTPRFPSMLESGMTGISAEAGKDPNKVSRLLDFYEWTITQEGTDFFTYGIKGIDYKIDENGYAVPTLPASNTTGAMKKLWEVYPSIVIGQLVSFSGSNPTPTRGSMFPQWIIDRYKTVMPDKNKYAVATTIDINNLTCDAKSRHMDAYDYHWYEDQLNRIIAENGGKSIDQGWADFKNTFFVTKEGDQAIKDINAIIQAKGLKGQD